MHFLGLVEIGVGFILGFIGAIIFDTFLDESPPPSDELARYSSDSKRALREYRIRKFLRWLV